VRLFRRKPARDPDELVSKILFTLGYNTGLLKADGLWTADLQALQDTYDAALQDANTDPDAEDDPDAMRVVHKSLSRLVGAVEGALTEHGIEHPSILDFE
jgi:hypothetical protein